MATCGSLQHFFEKPLPENPTLESLATWNQIKPRKPLEPYSFTEIFGQLHFEEKPKSPQPSSSSSSPPPPSKTLVQENQNSNTENPNKANKAANSSLEALLRFSKSQYSSSSLQLCTEGLGFESSDDVEELASMKVDGDCSDGGKEKFGVEKQCGKAEGGGLEAWWDDETVASVGSFKRSKPAGEFPPPPITSIMGRQGKPSFFLKSYRQDGRFVLREFKVPSKEFLHACREDGRLKLNFVVRDTKGIEHGGENRAGKEGISRDECSEDIAGNGIS